MTMTRDSPGHTQFINLANGSTSLQIGTGSEREFTLNGETVAPIDTPGSDAALGSNTDVLMIAAKFLAAM